MGCIRSGAFVGLRSRGCVRREGVWRFAVRLVRLTYVLLGRILTFRVSFRVAVGRMLGLRIFRQFLISAGVRFSRFMMLRASSKSCR